MSKVQLAQLITPERIVLLKASDKARVLRALSRLVAAEAGLNEEAVLHSVLAVERLTAFGVGRGVAVPHAVMSGISNPIGTFARLRNPVDFDAADGRLVDLVFLLLAPRTEAGTLLPLLSCVVRRLRDREVIRHLRAGSSAEVAYAILATDSWRSQAAQAAERKHSTLTWPPNDNDPGPAAA